MLGDNEYGMSCLRQLNGTIKIIRGNHDTDARWKLYATLPNVECIGWAEVIKYKKYQFYLSHYPTMTSNLEKAPHLRMHLINLFGHIHQQNKFYMDTPYLFHVGLDSNNCTPILLDDAIEMMKKEIQICLNMLGEGQISDADEPVNPTDTAAANTPTVQSCNGCAIDHLCPDFIDNIRCNNYQKDFLSSKQYS